MYTSSRRRFLSQLAAGGLCLGLGPQCISHADAEIDLTDGKHIFATHEALYYEKLDNMDIRCKLCPRECEIGDKERGWCGARENQKGTYYTLVYGNPCACNIDPIEKKPFFHYLPGTTAASIATAGCNLNCKYCQNWQISQSRPEQTRNIHMFPDELVEASKGANCASIAFTYAEPTIFYEYMLDVAQKARQQDLGALMVSAGYMQIDPLKRVCEHLTAVKIDMKSFRDEFYRKVCGATLEPVLDTLKTLKQLSIWFEIVMLVVPTLNDSEQEMRDLSAWIMAELGPDVPLHFSRFFPTYQLKNLPPTPMQTLEMAHGVAKEAGIHYPYIGNVNPDHPANQTYCHHCDKRIIQRSGFLIQKYELKDGKCLHCEGSVPGVWQLPDTGIRTAQTSQL